ncbi:MAG: LCP family protein [Actinomycetota bacterium]
MPSNGEQRPPRKSSGEPEYKVYRSRRGLFSRLKAPDISSLRDRARSSYRRFGMGGPQVDDLPPTAPKSLARRVLKWVGIAALAWIAISFAAFAVSAQIQKWKLADGAKDVLGGNPFLLASPQTILVIGTDARPGNTQEPGAFTDPKCLEQQARGEAPHGGCSPGQFRADTLMLVRAGGAAFRKLSIPRDSFAEIPGVGAQKINGAYAFGGAKLQIQTVEQFLGIQVDHVVIVDFEGFEDFIDSIGGVEITLPRKFCADISGGAGGGQGGITIRLKKGENTLNGQKALAYSRVRHPSPCPGPGKSAFGFPYDDLNRAKAQQQVLNGIKSRLTSPLRLPYNFIKGPIIGWTAPKAIVTDMGALTMPQLVLASVFGSNSQTDVLKPAANGPGASLEISEAERQRAVNKLIG